MLHPAFAFIRFTTCTLSICGFYWNGIMNYFLFAWHEISVLFFPLFIFFYWSNSLETRLSHFASIDCTDSKKPISSSRLEQWHCLLSVDFVTQRLPRDRLQTDSYKTQSSKNFFFFPEQKKRKKKNQKPLPGSLALSVGTASCIHMAGGKKNHLIEPRTLIITWQTPKSNTNLTLLHLITKVII